MNLQLCGFDIKNPTRVPYGIVKQSTAKRIHDEIARGFKDATLFYDLVRRINYTIDDFQMILRALNKGTAVDFNGRKLSDKAAKCEIIMLAADAKTICADILKMFLVRNPHSIFPLKDKYERIRDVSSKLLERVILFDKAVPALMLQSLNDNNSLLRNIPREVFDIILNNYIELKQDEYNKLAELFFDP